ncbi:catalase domain containing protein [Niveomyces insectorum RCEF 264]|uniref:Catalase domain containing protein n=1 Tax=Niveomyces insectorum RCEF 264 TaxID=1081102 RepID=A0A168A757_9HYPO|nr:catalase domain containing protein [Niveomyces insectorum RCEF 264]
MPLPTDDKIVGAAKEAIDVFKGLAGGPHPGFRPAHAKGILLKGTFTPTAAAAALSKATHFQQASTPVLVRFSSSTGLPQIPDSDPNGNPRGIALRFLLPDSPSGRRQHTDIVAHSAPLFPAATPDETLAFFKAVAGAGSDPAAFSAFVAAHPAAQAFLQLPKPTPSAFARETFYSVTAFKLVNAAGKATYVRYRIEPVAGPDNLSDEVARAQAADFLYAGVRAQVHDKKEPIQFRLVVQIGRDGDVTDNSTVRWADDGPDKRDEVELGRVSLDALFDESDDNGAADAAQQKYLIFDPVPRVEGVEPSADPLLDFRAAIYLLSGRERRAA